MAEKDPKRNLSDEDNRLIEDSEHLTRIVSTLLKTFEEDKESLRSAGRKLQDELLKLKNSAKSKKGKDDIQFVIQLLKDYGEKRVGSKNFVSKLKNLLEVNSKEIELLRRQTKEKDYTIDRTGKKLTGATAKIKELQKQYKAKVAEIDRVSEDAKLSIEEKDKQIKSLESEMDELISYMDDEVRKIREEDNEFAKLAEEEINRIREQGKKDLEEAFEIIERKEQKLKENSYTLERTQTKLKNATAKIRDLQKQYKETSARLSEMSNENSGNAEERQRLQTRLNSLRRDIIRHEIYNQFGITLTTEAGEDRAVAARYELFKEFKDRSKKTKEQKRNRQASNYDATLQNVINALREDKIVGAENITFRDIDGIVKDEIQPTLVKKHPFEAIKTIRSKDGSRKVNDKTKKSLVLRLASLGATLILGLGLLVSAGTTLGVNLGNAHDTIGNQQTEITQGAYESQEETLSAMIKEGSAYIYDTEENADKKMQGMGANSNGFVSLTVDDHVVELYNKIKDASEKTAEIIVLDEDGQAIDGAYVQTLDTFESAIENKDENLMQECITKFQGYANTIGNASKISKGNNEEIVTASADTSTNVTYYQQANQAWNEMNSYLDQQYSEIIDLATTPVLDVNFDVNEIKSDADLTDILTNGTGAVKDVLSCKYERETGKVSMLIECVSMKGSYTVETKFNMTPNLKVVDSHTIANGMKEAGYNITSTKFDTTLSSGLEDTNVTMSVNGEKVSGKAKILYNIDAVYFENQGKNGTTKVTADAIVMITQEDGTIEYRTFEYDTNIAGKVDEKEVESDVLTELINKINASLDQEVQVDNNVEMENE